MNDRHDQKEQPKGGYLNLCQRIVELEGIAGQLEIDAEKFPEEAQPCTLAEAINDGLAMIDENMRITFANNRFCEIIGYSRDEVIGRLASDFQAEADKKIFSEQISRRKTGKGDQYELTLLRKDGEKAFVVISPRPILSSDGSFKGSIAVVTDITDRIRAEEKLLSTTQELEVRVQERTADLQNSNEELRLEIAERKKAEEEKRKLETQLLQAKKMEAISTLSGGVAQELSNLFQAVHGYVERLMWGKEQDDPRYQELLEITNAAFRGAVLSRRLLAFSGIIESKKHPIDLNQEIKKTHRLLSRTMPETIELELHLAKEPTIINGDPNQIEQAILALAVNARDAMPGGGKIVIETKRMILDQDFRRTHAGAATGECVLITLSDTGPGLGQETLEHVFDPFFSKEDLSEETGMGLSMVYGIVKNHGGYISCASEPEVGTTFMIYLPVTEKEVEVD
ncbi:MAG: PAS domain S-box protein [Desulfobacteria bacterium]